MEPIDKTKILQQIATKDYLPSLSPLTIQLIDVAADEHVSILDLTRIIEQDPGLTARILKFVNSAFYAQRERISSISYAVMVAGFKKIRLMALNISLKDTFPLGKVNGMDYDFFWKTSLYRALLAQGLTKGSDLSDRLDPDEVFTAGLILEIGLLLLFHVCPDSLKDSFPGGNVPLEETLKWEEENLGINHRELGRLTLQHWHFPDQIIEAQKIFGTAALEEGTSDLSLFLEVARICTQLFFGTRDDFAYLKEIARMLKKDLDRVSEILSEVFFKVEEIARELRLQINSSKDLLEVMEKANRALIRINGSLENNLSRMIGLFSQEDQKTDQSLTEPSGERKKFLEKAMDAVAHEIRNPLMAIGGFAQRLVKKGEEQVNVIQYAELIAQESRRLEQVLNDLMDYSNPYQPVFQDLDLVPVLEKAIEGLQDSLTRQQITLVKKWQKIPRSIPLEKNGFQKSFQQLLEIIIHQAGKGHQEIIISLETPALTPQIKIEIKYQGEPLPEETQEILLGHDFSNRSFGKSLGLSLSRRVIEAHKGRIEVNSEEGENRISIVLPIPSRA